MSENERRLAAIMFTDLVGFTTLGQANESLALSLLEEHRAVVRPIIARHRGAEVKTIGDAFLVEFGSALDAVECAVEIQKAMRERNMMIPEERRVRMRVGVHVGDVVHSHGDILGDAVNVSSRIEPLAPPGGVCISEQVYDHVRNKVDFPLEKLESKTLKNVSVPIEVYRIIMPWELRSEQAGELDSKRVAVLPLKNMSPDPNDEYFADGMTEELITSLSSVSELTVIARTSVMQYKNAPKRIVDVGRELGVGTIIEGSVRKAGTKVRITVQMVDAKNEGHLWAQNYDKQLDDVFMVQSEVAEKVAEALKVKLVDAERRRIEKSASTNPAAYNAYLQGLFFWNKRTPEALRKAVGLFEETVKIDPSSPLGYSGLGQAYFIIGANYYEDPAVYYPKAKEAVLKALSLDDGLAEGHAVLGAILSYYRDWDGGEAEFRKAIEINPKYPSAHQWYSQFLVAENRVLEAWTEINRALELSPLSLIINTNLADCYLWQKKFEKGVEQAKRVIEMDAGFPSAYQSLIYNLIRLSRFDEARAAAATLSKLWSEVDSQTMEAYILAFEGKFDDVRRILQKLEDPIYQWQVSSYFLSAAYFLIGEVDRGFEMMERAYERNDRYLMFMGVDFDMDSVRSDPRYFSMLKRIGLAERLRPRS